MSRKTDLSLTEMLLEMAENLTDESFSPEEVRSHVERAEALANIAEQVVNLKEVQVKELDINMKAAKTARELGYKFKPENINLVPLLPEEKKEGKTPEGLDYEW